MVVLFGLGDGRFRWFRIEGEMGEELGFEYLLCVRF